MNAPIPTTIVLVEDDDGHALLIEKNLRRAGVKNTIERMKDGAEAIDHFFLKTDDGSGQADGPCLVMLDLNLPVLDGFQVLKKLKGDARTQRIPIIVLTTADNPDEIDRCYQLGCNVFVTKPVSYDQFSDAVRKLGMFLAIASIPGRR